MKITKISLSVFDIPAITRPFTLDEDGHSPAPRFIQRHAPGGREQLHVMHVMTSDGIEGICTVGDARYTRMRQEDLEQLRLLVIGEDPLERDRLHRKVAFATREAFVAPGWAGAFDNCLWDIAGKLTGEPVFRLVGAARAAAPAYYNIGGTDLASAMADADTAWQDGFRALKDHFERDASTNIAWFEAMRTRFPDAALMHDAIGCQYDYREAVKVGRALEEQDYLWFEEPLPDRSLGALRRLCAELDIPVAACEAMMGDHMLCAEWLQEGAADILRANARHGTTPLLKLGALAETRGTTIELNGPGGLFGLVHAHLCCGVAATRYYEYFPGGARDTLGAEIGLLNPAVPRDGFVRPPEGPGWGAEWDRPYFDRKRIATL